MSHPGMIEDLALMTAMAIFVIGIFTFLSIAAWTNARKREREAFYRSELRKKLIEKWGGESPEQLVELLRDDAKNSELHQLLDIGGEGSQGSSRQKRDGILLAGLITTAVGIGMLIFLKTLPTPEEAANIGIIPLIVGVAILIYSYIVGRQ